MARIMRLGGAVAIAAGVLTACGGGGSTATRTVRVDYRADEFPSSFLGYYPRNVIVHPGDTVVFKQTWSGEPHSVTMGTVVDNFIKYEPLMEKYDSREAALADGVPQSTVDAVDAAAAKVPGMVDDDRKIYEGGARPCYVAKVADVPTYTDSHDNVITGPSTTCPTQGQPQPQFTGRQALYNSGYIPWQGSGANSYTVKIAKNATPGTYSYFCNYHWVSMSGTVKIVPRKTSIPSNAAANREALKEIRKAERKPAEAVRKATRASTRAPSAVLAGANTGDLFSPGYVSANEFFPTKVTAKVGRPVTWSFKGLSHTVSFNVPAYFPVFTVDKTGDVHYDHRAQDAVQWKVPEAVFDENGDPEPRHVDAGDWDGSGGFHSSGLLNEGDTFSVTFTKPGTYPYACAIHPQMIGQVVVTA
ncbi:MAG TPA: plastocyanin/azurin family copper-binding protein [Acidimicrobiales bacterium]|nr:plastocyanin/azurin family copper-binding protein [Acidimicrobiales bacterium]